VRFLTRIFDARMGRRSPAGAGRARPPCGSDYRLSSYRLLMHINVTVIDNIDHLAIIFQDRGRTPRRAPLTAKSILAAVFCNSARKARQTADSSCRAREIATPARAASAHRAAPGERRRVAVAGENLRGHQRDIVAVLDSASAQANEVHSIVLFGGTSRLAMKVCSNTSSPVWLRAIDDPIELAEIREAQLAAASKDGRRARPAPACPSQTDELRLSSLGWPGTRQMARSRSPVRIAGSMSG